MHRVYISASTQANNVGVDQYGTEQDRMMMLADQVKYWLETQKGKFNVFRNSKGWSLTQTVKDCNSLACELFIDNHTNAGAVETKAGDGGAEGTEVFYYHQNGINSKSYRIAALLYKYVAPLSPGKDRGILPDNTYTSSLYVIQNTNPPATLIEHIFHTNRGEVADFIARMDTYAKAEAQAICEYFGEKWIEPVIQSYHTYVVAKDDSLWNISAKFLGKGSRYLEIITLNGLSTSILHEGQVLKIPLK